MALGLRTMVIPTANNDSLYNYRGTDSRREWTIHLQVRQHTTKQGVAPSLSSTGYQTQGSGGCMLTNPTTQGLMLLSWSIMFIRQWGTGLNPRLIASLQVCILLRLNICCHIPCLFCCTGRCWFGS